MSPFSCAVPAAVVASLAFSLTASATAADGAVTATSTDAGVAGPPGSTPPRSAVVVQGPRCAAMPVDSQAFLDLLRVELAAAGVACCEVQTGVVDPAGAERSTIEVRLSLERCDPAEQRLRIEVGDLANHRRARRDVSLGDVARGVRPRALALIVAELVRALADEPAARDASSTVVARDATTSTSSRPSQPPPAAPSSSGASSSSRAPASRLAPAPAARPASAARPSPAPVTPPYRALLVRSSSGAPASGEAPGTRPPPLASDRPRSVAGPSVVLGATADFELRAYPQHGDTLVGGRAALLILSPRRGWAGELGLGGLLARRRLDVGDVTIRSPSVGASVGPRTTLGPIGVALGARAEVALALVEGQSDQEGVRAGSGSVLVFGLGVGASVHAPVGRVLRVRLGAEAGATLRGVTAQVNGQPVTSMRGAYVGATAGLELGR